MLQCWEKYWHWWKRSIWESHTTQQLWSVAIGISTWHNILAEHWCFVKLSAQHVEHFHLCCREVHVEDWIMNFMNHSREKDLCYSCCVTFLTRLKVYWPQSSYKTQSWVITSSLITSSFCMHHREQSFVRKVSKRFLDEKPACTASAHGKYYCIIDNCLCQSILRPNYLISKLDKQTPTTHHVSF